jgi:hypothetical protein
MERETVTGTWVGKPCPRPGRENDLAPPERARYARSPERIPLELRPDGSFRHKESTEGTWDLQGPRIHLRPTRFMGRTLAEQQAVCEAEEREFRFAFVYEDWELEQASEDDKLVTPGESVIATVYERSVP